MKALVIGGTGFIGLNIARAIQEAGHSVAATRRPSSNTIHARRLKVPLRPIDLDDPASIAAALDGCDTVFFAAGHYPRLSIDTERQVDEASRRLRNVLDVALGIRPLRFVYTGSVATLAPSLDGSPASEGNGSLARAHEGSTYQAVKLALEKDIAFAAQRGLDVVSLLPSGCVGPGDHKVGTGFFVVAMANAAPPATALPAAGETRRFAWVDGRINIVDVRDVALAHVAAARSGSGTYILGGHDIRVRDLLSQMAELFQVPLPGPGLEPDEAFRLATVEEARCLGTPERPSLSREMVEMAVHGQFLDAGRARAELGFAPRPLEETLAASYEWFRKNGYIRRPAGLA